MEITPSKYSKKWTFTGKNKRIAVLLWIFSYFGFLQVYAFYLGFKKSAIVKQLLAVIFVLMLIFSTAIQSLMESFLMNFGGIVIGKALVVPNPIAFFIYFSPVILMLILPLIVIIWSTTDFIKLLLAAKFNPKE